MDLPDLVVRSANAILIEMTGSLPGSAVRVEGIVENDGEVRTQEGFNFLLLRVEMRLDH